MPVLPAPEEAELGGSLEAWEFKTRLGSIGGTYITKLVSQS